eukprot:3444099-Pyramimonas_sp.AAC.2
MAVLRSLPGFEYYDTSRHCLQCLKPSTGTIVAPRALSLRPRKTTRGFGLGPASCDEEFETSPNLLTARHVAHIYMAGTGDTIDKCVKGVEDTSGECSINKHTRTNCAVRYAAGSDGNATLDQDE